MVPWILVVGREVSALASGGRWLHKQAMSASAGRGALIDQAAQAEGAGLWTIPVGFRWVGAVSVCGRPDCGHRGDESHQARGPRALSPVHRTLVSLPSP
jgi:phosphoglucomutase